MVDISEIWIVDASGKCIYNYSLEQNSDPNLFAGFFSALNQFGKNLSKKELNCIEFGDEIILLKHVQAYNLLIIGKGIKVENNKAMKESMHEIVQIFKNLYPPNFIEDWDGNLDAFEELTCKINQLFFENGLNCVERYKSIF
ncbi:hypothetical protein NEF87_004588 [Candidatus Lokiarchaeum ossiferum]|uniref:FUZ/MON1/HPS1 first Longin domain-containing protein n=1 Tax=Candidatus Lokiarchaeum ossiferum TaxID=2951803 RepID=A0ABY6HY42_9ARCH|nr:hypothetical protein NEF87_004588 [Candidatus Lokiarchaeum sp. B-35]